MDKETYLGFVSFLSLVIFCKKKDICIKEYKNYIHIYIYDIRLVVM